MPGSRSYGPAGKWIHDRAHGIMADGDTPKNIAYAIATQQAHKVGKSPKDFRTPSGVREAKQKYDEPKSEYQKTAMMKTAISVEMLTRARDAAINKAREAAKAIGYKGMKGSASEYFKKVAPDAMRQADVFTKAIAKRGRQAMDALHKVEPSLRRQMRQEAGRMVTASVHDAKLCGFFDEMQKISQTSQALEGLIRGAGGSMTPAAYAQGHADWLAQKARQAKMPEILARYGRAGGSAAKPAAAGILSKLKGLIH